jgi:hypothetical protein
MVSDRLGHIIIHLVLINFSLIKIKKIWNHKVENSIESFDRTKEKRQEEEKHSKLIDKKFDQSKS